MAAAPRSIAAGTFSTSKDDPEGAAAAEPSPLEERLARTEHRAIHQAMLLSLLAELLDEPTLARSLDTFAGDLQRRFAAERVVIALADNEETLRLGAISQQADVHLASAEVALLLGALREACERESPIRFPEHEERFGVLEAHRALAGWRAARTIASLPLFHRARLVGALLIERRADETFGEEVIESLEQIALVSAPLLALRCEAERGALERCRRHIGETLGRRVGGDRPGTRLSLAAVVLALALAALVPIDHRVVADAELVPRERRLVTAPIDGFIDEIAVASGERVEQGQVLARLDRRELELELARRDSDSASAEAEFRAAMASHDRQAIAVSRARLARERALRDLVEQRLARSDLRAPIAGLIISTDPADLLGSPVTRGESLFEIAPAEGYEVHLLVDERDVHDVYEGQHGALALRARADEAIALRVAAVHPVAESGGGASRFRVRAKLVESPGEALRPGQRGVARLGAGTTTLAGKLLSPLLRRLGELRWRLMA